MHCKAKGAEAYKVLRDILEEREFKRCQYGGEQAYRDHDNPFKLKNQSSLDQSHRKIESHEEPPEVSVNFLDDARRAASFGVGKVTACVLGVSIHNHLRMLAIARHHLCIDMLS